MKTTNKKTTNKKIYTPKIHMIYTHHPEDFNEDEMREAYLEDAEVNNWNVPEDGPSDDELWEHWHFLKEIELEDIEAIAKDERGYFLVQADLGLWNGRFEGGKIIYGLWDAIRGCFEDYNEIYMEGRDLKVKAIHHDGTNYFRIRELTDKGVDYYDKHEYDYSDRELHERLAKDSHYTHCVRLFADYYGWKV